MTTRYTTRFQIGVPDFLSAPWHDLIGTAFDKIDAVMYGVAAAVGAPPWQNNKVYVLGNLALDTVNDTMYMCLVGHTSAIAPTTFSADRVANPTYWQAVVAVV